MIGIFRKELWLSKDYDLKLTKFMAWADRRYNRRYQVIKKDKYGHPVPHFKCSLCGDLRSEIMINLLKSDPIAKQVGKRKVEVTRVIICLCPSCATKTRNKGYANVRDVATYIAMEKRKIDKMEKGIESTETDSNVLHKGKD